LLSAVGFGIYGQFLTHWFVTDDFVWLRAASNPDLSSFIRGAFEFPRGPTPYWRPAIDVYFFGMYRLFHLNATAYLTANLLVHILSASLIALIASLCSFRIAGLLAGVIFVASPAFGSVVTWASGVTELLATFFSLLAVASFLHYRRGRKLPWLLLSIVAFVLGLLAHETTVMLPAILVVLAFAADPVRTFRDARALAIFVAPMLVIDIGYVALQFSQVLASPSGGQNYAVTFEGADRLLDRMLWLSVPVPTGEDWVEPARWAVFSASLAAVALGARYRNWALPGLFLATVLAVLPTIFLTRGFSPRWVYFAAAPWSAFVAVLIISAADLLRERCQALAYAAVSAVLLLGGYRLVPEAVDVQRWSPTQASQMETMSQLLQSECPNLGASTRVLLFPLPVVDPGYVVPSLVGLLYPGAEVELARPAMRPPAQDDCLLEYADGQYRATAGHLVAITDYWAFLEPVVCPGALDWQEAARFRGENRTVTGPLVSVRTTLRRDRSLLDIGRRGVAMARLTGSDALDAFVIFRELPRGTTLCVTGTIGGLSDFVLIDVDSPQAIRLRRD
jgi:hypothetical protein